MGLLVKWLAVLLIQEWSNLVLVQFIIFDFCGVNEKQNQRKPNKKDSISMAVANNDKEKMVTYTKVVQLHGSKNI